MSSSPKVYEDTPAMEAMGEVKSRPCIPIQVFTPLLGSMLLSQNSSVADPTRAAVVAIIAKLRGLDHATIESWEDTPPAVDRRSYVSQTGFHTHEVYQFSARAKQAVENELLEGLVLGMGKLDARSTEGGLQRTQSNLEDHQEIEGMSAEEVSAFHAQLSEEAIFGRAISMNLIASVAEFYPPEAVQRLGFVDAVLAGREDELVVKTEAALALAYLAKVAPSEHVGDMVSLHGFAVTAFNLTLVSSRCLSLSILPQTRTSRFANLLVLAYLLLLSGWTRPSNVVGSPSGRCGLLWTRHWAFNIPHWRSWERSFTSSTSIHKVPRRSCWNTTLQLIRSARSFRQSLRWLHLWTPRRKSAPRLTLRIYIGRCSRHST
jgi:serine/threonine-protein phosphatase 4 regulatory subunit 1